MMTVACHFIQNQAFIIESQLLFFAEEKKFRPVWSQYLDCALFVFILHKLIYKEIFTSLCIEEAKVKVFTNANLSHTNHCKTLYNSGILQVYFKLIQLGVTWSCSPTHLDGVLFLVFLVKPVSIKMSLLFWNQAVIKVYFPTSFSCTLVFLLIYFEVVCSYL